MDDDEFGGFEAAAEDEQEAREALVDGVQASPSPWAYFPGQNQPDLIRPPGQAAASASAEIRPNVQDPLEPNFPQGQNGFHDAAGGAMGGAPAAHSKNAPAGASVGLDWEADFKEFDMGPDARSLSEQVLEPHFGSIKSEKPVPDGVLDLDLTQRQQGNRQQEDLELEPNFQNVQAANEMPPLEDRAEASQSDDQRQNELANEGAAQENVNEVAQEVEVAPAAQAEGGNVQLQGQLRVAEEQKTNLQKELQELISSNQLLEEQISTLRGQLDAQRAESERVQERHLVDLEEMRGAGQGALALIVEEYKELCKVAVLEQQNTSQVQLQEAIVKEQEKWKAVLRTQQEEFEAQLEEERKKMCEEIKQSLAEETAKHRENITKLVSEERQHLQEELQKSVEQIKQETDSSISGTFTSERQKWTAELEEEKNKMKSLLSEERELSKEALSKAVEEESQKCQECMKAAIKEERLASEKVLQEAVKTTQDQMNAALEEQKQRDLIVKKKSLLGVDLLLESARHQLNLLLDRDPQLDPSPDQTDRSPGHADGDKANS